MSTELQSHLPHAARIGNYWTGGTDNVPADRAAGDAVWRPEPGEIEHIEAYRAVARKP